MKRRKVVYIGTSALASLRPSERAAWRRWHLDLPVGQVARIRAASGTFPLIQGGLQEQGSRA